MHKYTPIVDFGNFNPVAQLPRSFLKKTEDQVNQINLMNAWGVGTVQTTHSDQDMVSFQNSEISELRLHESLETAPKIKSPGKVTMLNREMFAKYLLGLLMKKRRNVLKQAFRNLKEFYGYQNRFQMIQTQKERGIHR